MVDKVIATPAALELIAFLKTKHGPELMFPVVAVTTAPPTATCPVKSPWVRATCTLVT